MGPKSHQRLLPRKAGAAFIGFVLLHLLCISVSYADFKSDIVLDFSETKLKFFHPLNEQNFVQFKVTNRGTKDYYFMAQELSCSGGPTKSNPQGQPYLRPGDSMWFRTMLPAIQSGQVGETFSWNYHIELQERDPLTLADGDKIVFDKPLTITVVGHNGPVNISGTVLDENGNPCRGVSVSIIPEEGYEEFGRQITDDSGNFSFAVADASYYRLGFVSSGYERGFLYVEKSKNSSPYRISLKRSPVWSVKTSLLGTLNSFVGFHRIAVTRDETRALFAQGCENWMDVASRAQSRIYLYDVISGQRIWDRPMGWDSYSSDISEDGTYVVYATGSLVHLASDPVDFIRLLRGSDGSTIWTKTANSIEFPGTRDYAPWVPSSRSVKFSHNGSSLLVGMDIDYVYMLNRADGSVKWKNWVGTNVRETSFSSDDKYVYVPAGQGWVYKFSADDGREIWRLWAGSWATIGGLCFSPDGRYLAVGTKSGHLTMIDTVLGSVKFRHEFAGMTGYCEFSKDGTRVILSGGCTGLRFCDMTGKELWNYPLHPSTAFSPDGRWLINTYNEGTFLSSEGTWISSISPQTLAVHPYFGWLNSSGTRYITFMRDTTSSNQTVLKIYSVEVKSALLYPPLSFSGQRVVNRSLSQAEYNNVLTWQANPGNANLAKYRLYISDGPNPTLIAELSSNTLKYTHRKVLNNGSYLYSITSVNADGMESASVSMSIK